MADKFRLPSVLTIASLLAVSCNSPDGTNLPDSQSGVNPGGPALGVSPVMDHEDEQNLSSYVNDSATGDISNAGIGFNLRQGLGGGFGFPLWGIMLIPNSKCVTVTGLPSGGSSSSSSSSSGSNGNFDITETFNCPNITGSIQVQNSNASTGDSFSFDENITISNSSGDSRSTDDTLSVSKTTATDVVGIGKTFDDTFGDGTNTYEAKGSSSYTLTPTSATQAFQGGAIQFSSSMDFTKNGSGLGTFDVTSNGLTYAACGLNAGTIDLTNGTWSCVITFSGCGRPSMSCTNPNPSPSPTPSATPSGSVGQ